MALLRVTDENGNWAEIPAIVGAPGKDGTSVEITRITESTESGGSNIVEFSDGSILTVRNGKDGEGGSGGGTAGEDGEDGGYYTPTVTQPDANTMRVAFSPSKSDMPSVSAKDIVLPSGLPGANGAPGQDGKDGEDGYTPVRGTDYWTDADKAEIKSYVDEAILGGAW